MGDEEVYLKAKAEVEGQPIDEKVIEQLKALSEKGVTVDNSAIAKAGSNLSKRILASRPKNENKDIQNAFQALAQQFRSAGIEITDREILDELLSANKSYWTRIKEIAQMQIPFPKVFSRQKQGDEVRRIDTVTRQHTITYQDIERLNNKISYPGFAILVEIVKKIEVESGPSPAQKEFSEIELYRAKIVGDYWRSNVNSPFNLNAFFQTENGNTLVSVELTNSAPYITNLDRFTEGDGITLTILDLNRIDDSKLEKIMEIGRIQKGIYLTRGLEEQKRLLTELDSLTVMNLVLETMFWKP